MGMLSPAVQTFQKMATYSHFTKFQLAAPVAAEALGIFDMFNLWFSEATASNDSARRQLRVDAFSELSTLFCDNSSGWGISVVISADAPSPGPAVAAQAVDAGLLLEQFKGVISGDTIPLYVHMSMTFGVLVAALIAQGIMEACLKRCCVKQVQAILRDEEEEAELKRKDAATQHPPAADKSDADASRAPANGKPLPSADREASTAHAGNRMTAGEKLQLLLTKLMYRAPFPRLVLLVMPSLYNAMLSAIIGRIAGVLTGSVAGTSDQIAVIVVYALSGSNRAVSNVF